MELNSREKKVLESIINYYLEEGVAVGSRTLVKKYEIDLSAATIRNVMADLEDKGYLEKSHTSSGRAPTSKSFKLYIDSLLKISNLSKSDLAKIENISRDDNFLSKSTELLSNMTHQASFALEPNILKERLKKIELVYLNRKSFLAVLVTDGSVKTKRVVLTNDIKEEDVKNLSQYMNNLFKDEILEDIQITSEAMPFKNEAALLQGLITQIESKVHLSGSESLINYLVESKTFDMNRCKMFQANEEMKLFLESLVDRGLDNKKINIILGDDLESEKLKGLSFVFSTYERGSSKGMLGVVGPRRMEYGKVASVVEQLAAKISKRGEDE